MNVDYFTRRDSQVLKGLMTILILIHHIYQRMPAQDGSLADFIFRSFGFMGVAVFFFISGYGITCSSNKTTPPHYLDTFIRYRVLSIYLVYVALFFLYGIVYYVFKIPLSIGQIVSSFLIGGTIVGAGWYIQALLLFYLIWYVSKSLFGDKSWIPVFGGIFLFNMISMAVDVGVHWSLSSFAFAEGVLIAEKKCRIDAIMKQHHKTCFVILNVTLVFVFGLCFLMRSPYWLFYSLRVFISLLFPLIFFVLSYVIPFKGLLLEKIGDYSLEIFLLQGIIFFLLRNYYWGVNDLLFVLLSVIGTLLLSYILHPLFTLIMGVVKK